MSAQDDVVSGLAWEQFCDALKQAGQQILRLEAPVSELDRAEGWRYLTRLLRIGLEMHLECADPDFPSFFAPSHETGKIGADNPDNLYMMARINGRNEYVVRGTRGSVSYLSIGTQKGGYESDGKMEQTGFFDAKDLELDAEGRFEIIVSAERPAGARHWLRIEPTSNAVLVRQTFLDRKTERPAQISIERRGNQDRPQPMSAERIQRSLQHTANFVNGTATLFANWAQSYLAHPNQLPLADQAVCQSVGGDPNIVYYHSYWQLADDEVLQIHLPRIPDCRFWNLQINNWWMESMDYRYHRAHFNKHSAHVSPDGSVTLLLSHRDPSLPNWLETAGHDRGTMCLRWVSAKETVDPQLRVIKLKDLKKDAA